MNAVFPQVARWSDWNDGKCLYQIITTEGIYVSDSIVDCFAHAMRSK